jgi:5,10-methylenetetrahydromethanopterin reductase
MLDREGVAAPEDVALIGDEDTVVTRLDEIRAAGVAEFAAHVFGPDDEDRMRTRTLLRSV